MYKLLVSFILFINYAYSVPTASVVKFRGDVKYNNNPITEKTIFAENGSIEIGKSSYLKIRITDFKSTMTFGPDSKLVLKFKKKKKVQLPYKLVKGVVRWTSEGNKKSIGGIKTPNAAMGVRGTDFITIVNPLLNESEIVCFDGEVKFLNLKSTSDSKIISKNQWGGLGGRFGKNIGDVLTLPAHVISYFKTFIKTTE